MKRSSNSIFRDICHLPYSSKQSNNTLYSSCKGSKDMLQRMKLVKSMPVHRGCVNTLCWNSAGDCVLSGSDDQHLLVTNCYTYKVVADHKTSHRANIFSAKYLCDNLDKNVVSCSGDGIILYTDMSRADEIQNNQFNCHYGTTYEVHSLPSEANAFLSCGEDGTVRLFDLREKTSCTKPDCKDDVLISCQGAVTALSVSPARPYQIAIGCSDSTVRVYDRRTLGTKHIGGYAHASSLQPVCSFCAPELSNISYRITSLKFSPEGDDVLVSYSSDYLYLFSIKDLSNIQMRCNTSAAELIRSAAIRTTPPVKRLRLRGDWSDTGPNARPERETGRRGTETIAQVRPTLQATLMQRMTDVLARMLNDPATRAALSGASEENHPLPIVHIPHPPPPPLLTLEEAMAVQAQQREQEQREQQQQAQNMILASQQIGNEPNFGNVVDSGGNSIAGVPQNNVNWGVNYSTGASQNKVNWGGASSTGTSQNNVNWGGGATKGTPQINANWTGDSAPEDPQNNANWTGDSTTGDPQSNANWAGGLTTGVPQNNMDWAGDSTTEQTQNNVEWGGHSTIGSSQNNTVWSEDTSSGPHNVGWTGNNTSPPPLSNLSLQPEHVVNPVEAAIDLSSPSSQSFQLESLDSIEAQMPDISESESPVYTPSQPSSSSYIGDGYTENSRQYDMYQHAAHADFSQPSTSQPQPSCSGTQVYRPSQQSVSMYGNEDSDDDDITQHTINATRMASAAELKRQSHPIEHRMEQAMCAIRGESYARFVGTVAPKPIVKQKYIGHRNARTMIKEASFWGSNFVMSGSDCGHVFIWDRETGELVMLLEADKHVVNCLQPHPYLPLLATSGIDYDVKLWAPVGENSTFDLGMAEVLTRRNEIMLEETRDTITVPASFMIRMLACLNQIRRGGRIRSRNPRRPDGDDI